MGSVSGLGTIYNLPNYHGELYKVAPQDTPFLSLIGGLNGGKRTKSTEFEWQTVDLRSTSTNNVALEGAAAPTAAERSRSNVSNVVEIHQSKVEVSYSKQAATGLMAGINLGEADNPVLDELGFQLERELTAIAVDIEKSFLNGTYQKPANNSTARQTRGLLTAIATNVNANGGTGRAISKAIIDSTLQTMFTNGARLTSDRTVIIAGPAQKVALSNLYSTATLSQPTMDRTLGGFVLQTVMTDFGTYPVLVDRWMPTGKIAIVDLSVCNPVWLEIPEKGLLFAEPLARTGASLPFQLYGECGLEYGPETFHGRIDDLN